MYTKDVVYKWAHKINTKIVHFQFAFLEILYPRSWVLKKQTANLQANLSITLWLTAYTAWKSVAHSIEELKIQLKICKLNQASWHPLSVYNYINYV